MDTTIEARVIGVVGQQGGSSIRVAEEYRAGLIGLSDFSHAMVLWAFDRARWDGKTLVMPPAYRRLDREIGTFATRTPLRPSPIAVSVSRILSVDLEEGTILLDWIDAEDRSPVMDIKPYHPSEDRIRDVAMPAWCAHWPSCREESADFDWGSEFTFS